MAMRSLVPWRRRARSEPLSKHERMRSLVEPIEKFLEDPWSAISGLGLRFDVQETAKEILVRARLPGFEREDVKVDVTENAVTVSASQNRRRAHGRGSHEEASRTFVRRFTLPDAVMPESASASFKEEVLELRLPRAKERRIRRIEIE